MADPKRRRIGEAEAMESEMGPLVTYVPPRPRRPPPPRGPKPSRFPTITEISPVEHPYSIYNPFTNRHVRNTAAARRRITAKMDVGTEQAILNLGLAPTTAFPTTFGRYAQNPAFFNRYSSRIRRNKANLRKIQKSYRQDMDIYGYGFNFGDFLKKGVRRGLQFGKQFVKAEPWLEHAKSAARTAYQRSAVM